MNTEIWKPITGYEGLYDISNHGRIRNCKGFIRKQRETKRSMNDELKRNTNHPYFRIELYRDNIRKIMRVHRLVAIEFVVNPCPNEYNLVNHIDGCTLNNHWTNLEWCNNSINLIHHYKLKNA